MGILFVLPFTTKADFARHNLKDIRHHITLPKLGGKQLYIAVISNPVEMDFEGLVFLRSDTTRPDVEFHTMKIEGKLVPVAFKDGEYRPQTVETVMQILYGGACSPRFKNLRYESDELIAEYSKECSRYSQPNITLDRWKWKGNAFEMVGTKTWNPYVVAMKRYKKRLAEGKIGEALKGAREDRLYADPTGGWGPCFERFDVLANAVWKKAKKLKAAGKDMEAYLWVHWLVNQADITSCELEEGTFFRIDQASNKSSASCLKMTEETLAMMKDFSTMVEPFNTMLHYHFRNQVLHR
ncbi:MAG: hypothetical protein AAF570_14175, partial [Bacteroidota bacterium]